MSEEITTQTVEVVENQPVETAQTLDDVYKQYGVEEQVQQFRQSQAQPVQQAKPVETTSIPDPYDTDAFRSYMENQRKGTTELHQSLETIATHLTQMQQKEARLTLEADIRSAVELVENEVQLGKPKIIEALLDAKAREDSRFKSLWENRDKNPKAWESALKVVSKEISNEFQFKVDPKLQEAQRARKLSQQSMATTKEESPDESWDKLNPKEFELRWNQMVSGGY